MRDGLQIERNFVPTETKIALIDALSKTGLKKIEITGFVHPKVIPQLADAEAVAAGIRREPGVRYGAFIPNARGAERAIAAGIDDLKAGVAVSDSFNRLNVRMTTEEGMKAIDEIAAAAKGTNSRLVGGIATAFGCPYEGPVSRDRMHRMMAQLLGHGAPIVYLADTTGVANPDRIRRTVEDLQKAFPDAVLGLHLHNTRGIGIANALAGSRLRHPPFRGLDRRARRLSVCTARCRQYLHRGFRAHGARDGDRNRHRSRRAHCSARRSAQDALGRPLPGMVMKSGKASDLHAMDAARVKVD